MPGGCKGLAPIGTEPGGGLVAGVGTPAGCVVIDGAVALGAAPPADGGSVKLGGSGGPDGYDG